MGIAKVASEAHLKTRQAPTPIQVAPPFHISHTDYLRCLQPPIPWLPRQLDLVLLPPDASTLHKPLDSVPSATTGNLTHLFLASLRAFLRALPTVAPRLPTRLLASLDRLNPALLPTPAPPATAAPPTLNRAHRTKLPSTTSTRPLRLCHPRRSASPLWLPSPLRAPSQVPLPPKVFVTLPPLLVNRR